MTESKREAGPVAGIGDRVLARITPVDADAGFPYQASTVSVRRARSAHAGIFRALPGGAGGIDPVEPRSSSENGRCRRGRPARPRTASWFASISAAPRASACRRARVLERLGNPDARQIKPHRRARPRHPRRSSPKCTCRGADQPGPAVKGRTDLRRVPLVTIDPPDARDHDDAVYAEADPEPGNAAAGWYIVAIADVFHYVRPGHRARHARRASAATRSISPTASCRCCPSASPTICARCATARTAPASPCA